MDECSHENREFDEGNWVGSPYGWETYPGWYCLDCGEMLDDEEPRSVFDDPDYRRQAELEDEMRNPL